MSSEDAISKLKARGSQWARQLPAAPTINYHKLGGLEANKTILS